MGARQVRCLHLRDSGHSVLSPGPLHHKGSSWRETRRKGEKEVRSFRCLLPVPVLCWVVLGAAAQREAQQCGKGGVELVPPHTALQERRGRWEMGQGEEIWRQSRGRKVGNGAGGRQTCCLLLGDTAQAIPGSFTLQLPVPLSAPFKPCRIQEVSRTGTSLLVTVTGVTKLSESLPVLLPSTGKPRRGPAPRLPREQRSGYT